LPRAGARKGQGTFVALLAGINVGGNRKVPMAELREVAVRLGWGAPRTYIASGNLVFEATGAADVLEATLETALAARFGFAVGVVVRTAEAWLRLKEENPFEAEAAAEANRVHALVSKLPPKPDAASALLSRAAAGEKLALTPSGLWAYYPNGMGTTKLTPTLVDKLVGSKVTARNWRTVLELASMTQASREV